MINRNGSCLFLKIIFLFAPFLSVAQQPDNTLLWSIRGKNLTKTSYLFGTIHLQDKRVFRFTDSVYNAIQLAEGFAMEIHPDSMMMGVFEQAGKNKEKAQSLKSSISKKEYSKLKTKLKNEFQVDPDVLTLRDAFNFKQKIIKPAVKEDDMPTIVDLYLYSIARDQGKKIEGLEKLSDQRDIVNDFGKNFKPGDLLNDHSPEKNFVESMIHVYSNQDLEKIRVMMSLMGDESEDKLLNFRNQGMARKLDSLMQENSYFAAVGAAHLPGEKGVIALLRELGYTVEPVMSKNTLPVGHYQYKNDIPWQLFTDPGGNFRISMPGKTTTLNLQGGALSMYSHMDMTQMKMYFVTTLPLLSADAQNNSDSILNIFAENYFKSRDAKNIEKKRFLYKDSLKGLEIIAQEPGSDFWIRMQLILDKQALYMLGVGSQKKSTNNDLSSAVFFKSLEPLVNDVRTSYNIYKEDNFELVFPGEPVKKVIENGDSSLRSIQYISMDKQKGKYYFLIKSEATPTYVINDDAAYFKSVLDGFAERTGMEVLKMTDTIVAKNKSKYILALQTKEQFLMHVLMIKRGSQVFSLMATSSPGEDDEKDVKSFFNSFSFLPYKHKGWQKQTAGRGAFSTIAPSPFIFVPVKEPNRPNKKTDFYAFDSTNSITYQVTCDTLNAYTWSDADTTLLSQWRQEYLFEKHPLLSSRYFHKGKMQGVEFITSCEDETMCKKVRIMLNGNKKITAYAFFPEAFRDEVNQISFFEELNMPEDENPDMVFRNSAVKLLDALQSPDSVTLNEAEEAMGEVHFDKRDFPLLLERAMRTYPLGHNNYRAISRMIFDEAEKLVDTTHINLIRKHYMQLDSTTYKYSYDLLQLVAVLPDLQAYKTIEQLMGTRMPLSGDPTSFIYKLRDSLLLTKAIYPFLLSKSDDSLLAFPLYILHKDMLDSGITAFADYLPYQGKMEKGLALVNSELIRDAESEYSWFAYKVIRVLGKLDAPVWDNWLNLFLQVNQNEIKESAALELLRRKKPVAGDIWKTVAADGKLRLDLYRELKKLKKTNLFPADYRSQKSFAESMLWESFEDEMPTSLTYVGEQMAPYKGSQKKFYLFKVIFDYDGERSEYLGVSGPFPEDSKTFFVEGHITGTYFDAEYTKGLEKKLVKEYLAYFEEEEILQEKE